MSTPHLDSPTMSASALLSAYTPTTQTVLLIVVLTAITSRVLAYQRGLKAVGYFPGFRTLFHPFTLPGMLVSTRWWNPHVLFVWKWRDTTYRTFGSETISYIPYLLGPSTIFTTNVDVFRQISSSSAGKGFIKPPDASEMISQWGMNVLAADGGDLWRKHRRIMGPAFNLKLYDAVWEETLKTYRAMITEEGWANKDKITVPVLQVITLKVALLVIAKCGFGFSFGWGDALRTPDGRMSVQEAFRVICASLHLGTFIPKWLRRLLPFGKIKLLSEAEDTLMTFMQQQVIERKLDIRSDVSQRNVKNTNVFSMLVEASETEEGKYKLDDSELIGNVFIMLFAGHETTAQTLAGTLGSLAVNETIQYEIYQQIISVVGTERDPVFADYDKLNKVLAAFLEAMRMFPPGWISVRQAERDTVIQVPNPAGEEGSKPVPVYKGTLAVIDMIGAQYNPRYFDNPREYRPSRWYETSVESELFSAFGVGARRCIGYRFATSEAVAFLTMLLREYKVVPLLSGNETKAEWAARVLDANIGLTLGVNDVPVTFVRRDRA